MATEAPKPPKPVRGAQTREAIAQARVDDVRSPARIARFAVAGVVAAAALVFGLSRFGVTLPFLPRHTADHDRVFGDGSADPGLGGLRAHPPPPPAPPTPTAAAPAAPAAPAGASLAAPIATKEPQKFEALAASDRQALGQLYAQQDLSGLAARTPPFKGSPAAADRAADPLTTEQVAQTIAKYQGGYRSCIDRELKRNPGFAGGKIRIVTTVGGSGIVQRAVIDSADPRLNRNLSSGELGNCLVRQTGQIVFPSFGGEPIDVEIPLVLGAAP